MYSTASFLLPRRAMNNFRLTSGLVLLALAACGGAEPPAADAAGTVPEAAAPASAVRPAATTAIPAGELPTIVVYKTESCGCCNGWVEHLEAAGFTVDARNVTDLMSIKHDAGVPMSHASCHTALVDGYVVEGHVPADVLKRMLAERPEITGIAVPGMPTGSPGMEGPNPQPYDVLAFDREGGSRVYANVDPR